MPRNILIVDDEPEIRGLLVMYFEKEGFQTGTAVTGVEALNFVKAHHPDLVILDLMLPDLGGLEVCKRIRNDPQVEMIPIIMLTAKAEESDRVIGLELGADDYVTKPFSPKELVARAKAVFRRLDRRGEEMRRYVYGALVMDIGQHEVSVDGKAVSLSAKEFGLLEQLLKHPGRVVTRATLSHAVWGEEYEESSRTVDVHIRRLKQKISMLEDAIVSVKTLGYKLKALDHPL
jgi:DNA-binding response OmpR family regulator